MGISLLGTPLEGTTLQDVEYRRVFAAMSQDRLDGLMLSDGPDNFTNRRIIVELAEKARLPTIYPIREPVELGGLMAYVPDMPELYSHAAQQIDQILRGAKPPDIPFYQATKFELILNLKTAKALGLTVSLVADEVIE
jgi:putative ABC transport system substrate-binding protein